MGSGDINLLGGDGDEHEHRPPGEVQRGTGSDDIKLLGDEGDEHKCRARWR